MMMTARRSAMLLGTALLAAGCALPTEPPDGDMLIRYAVSGRVRLTEVVLRRVADDRHRCLLPRGAGQPPGAVVGYSVVFGPDFPPEVMHLAPEWVGYGPQTRFTLDVFPHPGAPVEAGPIRPGRAFRITVAAGDRLWERTVAQDNPAADAVLAIAPDGLSGRFNVAGLIQQIPHNRMPDDEAIAVAGIWRCPAR